MRGPFDARREILATREQFDVMRERLRETEQLLEHEKRRSRAFEQRAEAMEHAARNAYRFALMPRTRDEEKPS